MKIKSAILAAVGALSMASIAHADTINFGQFGSDGTTVTNGSSGLTGDGVTFTISGPADFSIYTQSVSWSGNFPDHTPVILDGGVSGAITINFATAISSISSLGVESNFFGPYTATLMAYDASSTLLGTQSFSSVSAFDPNSVESFNFSAPGIMELVISSTNDGAGIGLGGAGGTGTFNGGAVPEPATWAMMLLGFGMVGYAMRKRANVTTSVRFG